MISLVKSLGVRVTVLPRMFEVVSTAVEFDTLNGVTVLGIRRFGLVRSSRAVKRAMDHRRRLHLTPGMTGDWQILGSARILLHEMVKIDYLYVTNWSLWGDVKILARTILYVFGARSC